MVGAQAESSRSEVPGVVLRFLVPSKSCSEYSRHYRLGVREKCGSRSRRVFHQQSYRVALWRCGLPYAWRGEQICTQPIISTQALISADRVLKNKQGANTICKQKRQLQLTLPGTYYKYAVCRLLVGPSFQLGDPTSRSSRQTGVGTLVPHQTS